MQTILISLIISLLFSIFYILYSWRYKKYIDKLNLNLEAKGKRKTVSKFATEKKQDIMKDKLQKISKLIAETEKYIEDDIKEKLELMEKHSQSFETELIEKGGKEYRLTTAGLKSAMPKTERELLDDMQNLSETIEKLEALDIEIGSKKPVDIGKGMYYEKMSRKFLKIIQNKNLNEDKIIPIQKLKYHLFSNIKNIKNDDVLPILSLMKETKLINDLIEINPTFHFITTEELDLEFTNPERVALSFTYDEENLTIEKLLELTQWDYQYAEKIVSGLTEKGMGELVSDKITIYAYKNENEKKEWNKVIDSQIQKGKKKEEERTKRKDELKRKLKAQISDTKKKLDEREGKIERTIESIKDETEEVPKIKFDKKPSVKSLPQKEYEKGKEQVQENDIYEEVSQRILRYHEKYSIITGGITQFEKIEDYIHKKYPKVSKSAIKSTIKQLMDLNLVYSSIMIGNSEIFLFKDISLNQREKKFIKLTINEPPMTKEELIELLNWMEKTVLKTMRKLQEKGILRIEADKIIIPGIVQE